MQDTCQAHNVPNERLAVEAGRPFFWGRGFISPVIDTSSGFLGGGGEYLTLC